MNTQDITDELTKLVKSWRLYALKGWGSPEECAEDIELLIARIKE